MDLPKEAKRAPSVPVWNQSFPSPRWICLKRLSELHLPRFGIKVFLLLRHCLSAVPSLSGATLLSILEGITCPQIFIIKPPLVTAASCNRRVRLFVCLFLFLSPNCKTRFSQKLSNLELSAYQESIIGPIKSKMAEIRHLENQYNVIFTARCDASAVFAVMQSVCHVRGSGQKE